MLTHGPPQTVTRLATGEKRTAIRAVRFRVLLHFGQAVFKKVGRFDEIAGQDVILIHRLMKNKAKAPEYALMTEEFYRLSGGLNGARAETAIEMAEGLGEVPVRLFPLGSAKD